MLELLADEFREGGYSHRQLLKTIALSAAWVGSKDSASVGRRLRDRHWSRT